MKENDRNRFRWAPHVSGPAAVRRKDYQEDGQVEASSPYAAWKQLRDGGRQLQVGDLLLSEDGQARIYKYVGFEPAVWEEGETPDPAAAA